MSVFRTKGVILGVHPLSDTELMYDVFTYDYGKITVSRKIKTKEKTLDLGYIINFEVYTKEGRNIHKMKNIKILAEFDYMGKSYDLMENYLKFLKTAYRILPEGVQVKEAFEIFELVNEKKKLTVFTLILGELKLIDIAGLLPDTDTKQIKKIFDYIRSNRWRQIIKLTCDEQETIDILNKYTHF